MRQFTFSIFLGVLFLGSCSSPDPQSADSQAMNKTVEPINPVIGNESFVEVFDHQPAPGTSGKLRIQTHLKYVEQKLRARNISNLSPELQAKRKKMLALLKEYRKNGKFPVNNKFENERKPCFIDGNGNICAVGYLVAQTAGPELAEQINDQFQYAKIHEMTSPALKKWAAQSGLTLNECAMIQPRYRRRSSPTTIDKDYGIASGVLSGSNLSLSLINGYQATHQRKSNLVPIAGLMTGAGQTTLGILGYPENDFSYEPTKEHLSMINMGMGTVTLITSAYNLLTGKKVSPDETVSWQLYSYPGKGDNVSAGISLTKQF